MISPKAAWSCMKRITQVEINRAALLCMRANGERLHAAWCLGRGCNHFRVLDVSGYPDDLPVPSFSPRLRCERCGHLGADARPNWQDSER
jgi:hypothetical protein